MKNISLCEIIYTFLCATTIIGAYHIINYGESSLSNFGGTIQPFNLPQLLPIMIALLLVIGGILLRKTNLFYPLIVTGLLLPLFFNDQLIRLMYKMLDKISDPKTFLIVFIITIVLLIQLAKHATTKVTTVSNGLILATNLLTLMVTCSFFILGFLVAPHVDLHENVSYLIMIIVALLLPTIACLFSAYSHEIDQNMTQHFLSIYVISYLGMILRSQLQQFVSSINLGLTPYIIFYAIPLIATLAYFILGIIVKKSWLRCAFFVAGIAHFYTRIITTYDSLSRNLNTLIFGLFFLCIMGYFLDKLINQNNQTIKTVLAGMSIIHFFTFIVVGTLPWIFSLLLMILRVGF